MTPQDTTKLKDKSFKNRYGDKMNYNYGCSPSIVWDDIPGGTIYKPQTDIYVYRISRTSECGHQLDMPWQQMKARCYELGVKHVPELMPPILTYNVQEELTNLNAMGISYEDLLEGDSHIDRSHIREGIAIRIEYSNTTKVRILKAKSFTFGLLEGYIKDNDEYIDLEEIS